MIQNGYHYYHLHFSWRAPVMPGRCAWCDHQARQVWTDGAILAESSPGVPGRPSGLATIAIRTAFIDGCVDRHHLGSIQIYWIHVRLRDELFTNQDPLGARIYSQTLDRRCYETAQECAKGVWCIANFQPSCSNLWLATYILSKLSKRILVLLSHEWLFWWEVCIVHAQSRNWLQKGLCLHRAACMLYSFERLTIFFKQRKQTVIGFQIGLFQDSCLYERLCPMQDQESAKCLASATSEIFRPSPRYSILGTVFASTASIAFWVDRKVIHQPWGVWSISATGGAAGRGFRKVVIQLQVAR